MVFKMSIVLFDFAKWGISSTDFYTQNINKT